jgi:hypothetical protein
MDRRINALGEGSDGSGAVEYHYRIIPTEAF